MATTKEIMSLRKKLILNCNRLNPLFSSKEKPLSWDEYHKAKADLEEFDNTEWERVV